MISRGKQSGAALILALIAATLLLALTTVSLDGFLLSARSARRVIEASAAFHAADTALTLCERQIIRMHRMQHDWHGRHSKGGADDGSRHAISVVSAASAASNASISKANLRLLMKGKAEPQGWRRPDAFDAEPGQRLGEILAVGLPITADHKELAAARCIAERWIDEPDVGRVYLLTARMPIGALAEAKTGGRGSSRSGVIGIKQAATAPHIARQGPAIWLQAIVEIDREGSRRHWRSVAEPP